jgi:hypothetical protein
MLAVVVAQLVLAAVPPVRQLVLEVPVVEETVAMAELCQQMELMASVAEAADLRLESVRLAVQAPSLCVM